MWLVRYHLEMTMLQGIPYSISVGVFKFCIMKIAVKKKASPKKVKYSYLKTVSKYSGKQQQ